MFHPIPALRLFLRSALALCCLATADAAPRPTGELEAFALNEIGIAGPVHQLATLPNGDIAVLAAGGLFVHEGSFWTRLEHIDWPETLLTLPNGHVLVGCSQGIVELAPSNTGSYDVIRHTEAEAMSGLHPLKSVAFARGRFFGLNGSTLLEVDRWGAVTRHQLPNWSNGVFAIGDELYFLGGTDGGISQWDFDKQKAINIGHFTELVDYAWTLRFAPRSQGGVWILVESQHIIGFDGEKTWMWPGSEVLSREAVLVQGFAETAPDRLAVGTHAHGLLLFNEKGQIERRIDEADGLPSSEVGHATRSENDELWGSGPTGLFRMTGGSRRVALSDSAPGSPHGGGNVSKPLAAQEQDSAEIRSRLAQWGLPVIEAMFPLDTGVRGVVRSIGSLPLGELAILTDSGFFIFDGSRWYRQASVDSPYRLLTLEDGRAFVACAQGIVELSPSPTGGYQPRRLTLGESMDGLHAFMDLAILGDLAFGLRGDQLLEIGPNGAYQRHKLPNWATSLFVIDDSLYFTGGGAGGINRWDPDTKTLIDLGHLTQPVNYAWPVKTVPRAEGGVWILFESNRVMGFDGRTAWTWPGSEALLSREAQIKSLAEHAPGKLAFGTASEGILLFDESGKLDRQLSKPQGLEDVNVSQIGADAKGDLWVTTKTAVSRVSLDQQVSVLDERHGLTESANVLAFFRNRLYVGTDAGLFVTADQPRSTAETFTLLDANRGITDLLVYDDHLFIAGGQLKVIDPSGRLYQLSNDSATNLHQPSRHPNLILSGNYKGAQSFVKANGRWILKESLPGPGAEIFSMAESADGVIWGGLGVDRVARIRLDAEGNGQIDHMPFPGSSPIGWSIVTQIEDEVYLNTEPCLRWDADQQAWVGTEMIYSIGGFPFGFQHVFGSSADSVYAVTKAAGGLARKRPNARVLGSIVSLGKAFDARANSLVLDEEGVAWIGGSFGLLRAADPYDSAPSLDIAPSLHRLVSLKDATPIAFSSPHGQVLQLQPGQNSLRIEVAVPNFAAHRHNQYQIYVEGLDSDWPDYSSVPFREVTNLDPGNYLLRIQGRDASGRSTSLLDLPFALLPHWYEQPWAYLIYGLIAMGLVGVLVAYSTKRHSQRATELQKLVAERTQEIEAKNVELERQAQTLEQKNAELEEKTDELVATTESLTQTLQQLQEAQQQLVATARTAGKAEVAINVLHNVGNVLNSINVSLSALSQRVATSNLPKLSKLAKLIDEQRQDLARFLSSDPRGKHVPDYLNNLSRALGEEAATLAEEIALMEEEVEHIKRIISAQQAHAKNLSLIEEINLRELCETAFTIISSNAYASRFEIENAVPEGLILRTDKHRLLDILLNLASNACDAVAAQQPELGFIALDARIAEDARRVVITLTDNGVGMDLAESKHVFSHGYTTKKTGHGFGLHSAANAAKALGGELGLTSPGRGQGATATLVLPLRLEAPPIPPAAAAPARGISQTV